MALFKNEKRSESIENSTRKNESKKGRIFTKFILYLLIGLVGLVLISTYLGLTHSYFNIDQVTVKGNRVVTDEEIVSAAKLTNRPNIFQYDAKKAQIDVYNLEHIEDAKITKVFPSKVEIQVVEQFDLGYIPVENGFLIVGGDLKISRHEENLSVEQLDKLIRISNAGYSKLSVGNYVSDILAEREFLEDLINQNLLPVTKEIDFGKENDDVKMRVNTNTVIEFGPLANHNYKFMLLEKIMIDLKEKDTKAIEILLNVGDNPVVVTE